MRKESKKLSEKGKAMKFQAISKLNKEIKENVLFDEIRDIVNDYESIHENKNIRVLWETGIRLDIAVKLQNKTTLISFELSKGDIETKSFLLLKEDLEWICK